MDQALTLKNRMAGKTTGDNATEPKEKPVRVISVTSGKGGVGKTNIVAALAVEFQRMGARVLIVDTDLGLANMDIVMGIQPRFSLVDVLLGEKDLADIIVSCDEGVDLIPAGSGIANIDALTTEQRLVLVNEIDQLERSYDTLILDTGAGISSNVLYFNSAAQEVIIVITPEPTSVADAYAMIKLLYLNRGISRFKLLMNQVTSRQEAMNLFRRISLVTERFLHLALDYLGHVVVDPHVHQSVMQQSPLVKRYPNAPASRCLAEIARRLQSEPPPPQLNGGIKFFLRRIIEGS